MVGSRVVFTACGIAGVTALASVGLARADLSKAPTIAQCTAAWDAHAPKAYFRKIAAKGLKQVEVSVETVFVLDEPASTGRSVWCVYWFLPPSAHPLGTMAKWSHGRLKGGWEPFEYLTSPKFGRTVPHAREAVKADGTIRAREG